MAVEACSPPGAGSGSDIFHPLPKKVRIDEMGDKEFKIPYAVDTVAHELQARAA